MFLFLLAACVDYKLDDDDSRTRFDTGEPPVETGEEPDSEETGETADTSTCGLTPPPATALEPTCADASAPDVADPWDVVVVWEYYSGDDGVVVMPAVANLTDDNGDGKVNELDRPDVAFTEWSGRLTAVSGPTGARLFRNAGYDGDAGVAVADVTGDGIPEILASLPSGQGAAMGPDGRPVWTSPVIDYWGYYPQPAVADLDNDGDIEVVWDNAVLDGRTGAIVARLTTDLYPTWRSPVVADLDLDGTREILLGNVVYAPDGSVLWENDGVVAGNWAAVLDADDDPEGEVVFVWEDQVRIVDTDGSPLASATLGSVRAGAPAVADFDGDGEPDIVVGSGKALTMLHTDGSIQWEAVVDDTSGIAGCSGWDIDGDGAAEVLYADQSTFRIHDGATGAVLYEDPEHESQTLYEYPVVADLDGDGSAEIVVASNRWEGGRLGVTAYGHAQRGWPAAGPVWGVHDFAVTNQTPDGRIPTGETPSWQVDNTFRARPAADEPGLADLYVTLGDVCTTGCDEGDVVQIAWQVGNRGVKPSEPATLTLYAVRGAEETAIATVAVTAIEPAWAPEGGVFTVPVEAVDGATALLARIEGAAPDCDAGDDESSVGWGGCE